MRIHRSVLVTLLIGLAAAGVHAVGDEVAGSPGEDSPSLDSCLASQCHAYRVAFRHSPHSVLDSLGWASRVGAKTSCGSCHGPLTKRDKEEGEPGCEVDTFAFRETDSPGDKAAQCLRCHAAQHPEFSASSHGQVGIDCTGCHDIHTMSRSRWPLQRANTGAIGSSVRLASPSAACLRCHEDVAAEFQFNERHRLEEGVLECVSCHDPHRRSSRLSLGRSVDRRCSECHVDKAGPFLFEHGAQRIEGCTACHSPHGSPNRHLLAFQAEAELCFACHVAVPGFHERFTLESKCSNCHSSIHGSNLDPAFLR